MVSVPLTASIGRAGGDQAVQRRSVASGLAAVATNSIPRLSLVSATEYPFALEVGECS